MQIRALKPGDTIYAVYNNYGDLYCDDIRELKVTKVITKDFVTIIHIDNTDNKFIPKRAVGYYTGDCAVNGAYFFCVTKYWLEHLADRDRRSDAYLRLMDARDLILDFFRR